MKRDPESLMQVLETNYAAGGQTNIALANWLDKLSVNYVPMTKDFLLRVSKIMKTNWDKYLVIRCPLYRNMEELGEEKTAKPLFYLDDDTINLMNENFNNRTAFIFNMQRDLTGNIIADIISFDNELLELKFGLYKKYFEYIVDNREKYASIRNSNHNVEQQAFFLFRRYDYNLKH